MNKTPKIIRDADWLAAYPASREKIEQPTLSIIEQSHPGRRGRSGCCVRPQPAWWAELVDRYRNGVRIAAAAIELLTAAIADKSVAVIRLKSH